MAIQPRRGRNDLATRNPGIVGPERALAVTNYHYPNIRRGKNPTGVLGNAATVVIARCKRRCTAFVHAFSCELSAHPLTHLISLI